jgi:predicted Zn-dependent protease
MEIMQRGQPGFRSPKRLEWKRVALCVLFIVLLPAPLFAQANHEWYKTHPVVGPTLANNRALEDGGASQPSPAGNKTCSIQPFLSMPNTVSVTSLQVPHKAQKEYDEACAALKSKKMPETEKHLRKATEIYPNYAAGWVMLGQVLELRQQTTPARDACSRASSADPNYLPAYLCMAEIAGRSEEWNEVLSLTSRALELDAVSNPYAYFFSGIAYFNLNRLAEAEKSALKAEEIDRDRREPLIQFLLAQIYEAKHDATAAASHLQQYRKIAADSQAADQVKQDSAAARNPK